ncbi:hypothetical protein QQF64_012219 [Cirrhinus molitorella]|uniref:Uncharacterized protein n=1 Tax=Cirrhinus molitorella TaxID=172907 RepID=A0ABR3LY22_9TELE
MSQQPCTHRLYSYRSDATHSVITPSLPPPLRSPCIPPSSSLVTVSFSQSASSSSRTLRSLAHTCAYACSHTHSHAVRSCPLSCCSY